MILTASKNDLAYRYAVMRCRESEFQTLDPQDIIAYRKRDYQTDVLVADGQRMRHMYRDAVVDHVSLDEIMILLIKGEKGGSAPC